MLGLLLTLSVGGQLLPCVHVGATHSATADERDVRTKSARMSSASMSSASMQHDMSMGMAMQMPMDMSTDISTDVSTLHHGTPASHHPPVAPGCAQLMACGLVVQAAAMTTGFEQARIVAVAIPVGRHLQYATAEREVESPPPRG